MAQAPATTAETNLVLDFSLRVGELLMSCGAGAADVTVTMQALAYHLGLRHIEVDVTFTSLAVSHQPSPEQPPLVHTRLVKQRAIDYDELTRVDHLVRDVLADRLTLAEARSALNRITSSARSVPRWAVSLGWGAMCAGVGLQLGGGPTVVLIALVAAVAIDRLQLVMGRRRLPFFYQQVAGGALATVLAVGVSATSLGLDTSLVVSANIIMLLAGIGFMGALHDALSGFYLTSAARVIEALVATAGIIAGVSAGLTFARMLGVPVAPVEPTTGGLSELGAVAAGSALCAAAFAFASRAPRRSLLPIAAVSSVATFTARAVETTDVGRAWSTGAAAFLIGVVSYSVAGRLRVPPLVVVVPAMVPMLPGLSIYRALSLLGEGGDQTAAGLLAMVTAVSVAIALASGVLLGEYVAQPLKREARRLESRLAGPRLVGPHRVRRPRPRRTAR